MAKLFILDTDDDRPVCRDNFIVDETTNIDDSEFITWIVEMMRYHYIEVSDKLVKKALEERNFIPLKNLTHNVHVKCDIWRTRGYPNIDEFLDSI